MTPTEATIVQELRDQNERLLALLAARSAEPAEESLPGLANEHAENMELVHIYRTRGRDVWRAEHKRVMAERKKRVEKVSRHATRA